jgi:hypothetical protein
MRCEKEKSNRAILSPISSIAARFDFAKIEILQHKLKVSPLGDVYEQEGDRIAEQVINMPSSPSSPSSSN